MIWALDGQVAARAGAVVSPTTADAGRRRAGGVQRGARPRHRRRRPQRRVRRVRAACTAASCSTSAASPASSTSTRPRWSSTWRPGTFGDHLEDELRTDHGAHPRPLAAVDRAVHGRRLARLPLGRPALDPLREDRGHGPRPRRRPRRRPPDHAPAARPARPSAPTSTSCSSAPRARSASSPAPGSASTRRPPTSAGRAYALPVLRRRASTPCAASCSAAARPRCCASTTRPRPTAPTRPATARCCSCSTRATAPSSTPRWSSSPRCAATPSRADVAHVDHWLEHRNDVAALEALISRGYVVDTMEVAGRWRDLPAHLRRHDRRAPRRRGHAVGVGPPVAQLHRRRLPLLHLRRQDGARRPRPLLPRGVGRRHPRRPRRRRRAVPPPRRRPEPQPLRGRGARPGLRRARRHEGRPRPERHPQPRQARARRRPSDRPGTEPMSILVIDVGTSGLRAAVVRPDATIAVEQHRELLPDTPAPGLVEFDADADGRGRARGGPRGAGRGRPGRRRRHRQPAGVDDRVGPRDRRAGRAGARLAGPAHDRHLPRAPGRRAPRRAERVGHQGRPPARRGRPRPHARPVRRHRRHVARVAPLRGRAPRHRRHQRRRHRRCSAATAATGTTGCSTRSASRGVAAHGRRLAAACVGPATALDGRAADRRARRRPAGVADRPGLRAARRWPRSPSAPAACSTSTSARSARASSARATAAASRSSPGAATASPRGASRP